WGFEALVNRRMLNWHSPRSVMLAIARASKTWREDRQYQVYVRRVEHILNRDWPYEELTWDEFLKQVRPADGRVAGLLSDAAKQIIQSFGTETAQDLIDRLMTLGKSLGSAATMDELTELAACGSAAICYLAQHVGEETACAF